MIACAHGPAAIAPKVAPIEAPAGGAIANRASMIIPTTTEIRVTPTTAPR